MILVDTSAWVDFFRGHDPLAGRVDALIEDNEVALCGPVLTELRRGFRTRAQRAQTLLLLGGCALLPQPERLWEEAGDLGFFLRRKGVTAKTLDLLIAVYALTSGCELLTRDLDFAAMKQAGVPLRLAR